MEVWGPCTGPWTAAPTIPWRSSCSRPVPPLDTRAARRLAREYETLADLSHPNVVRVFDVGVFQGYPYLVMELIEGLTLRNYLNLRGQDMLSSSNSFSSPRSRSLPEDSVGG